jgi:uncharacterized alkaline shock family protein YloU
MVRMFDRVVLWIYDIILVLISILFLGIGLGLVRKEWMDSLSSWIYTGEHGRLLVGVLGFVLLIIGISMMTSAYRSGRREETIEFKNVLGEIRISLWAIEEFIARVAEEVDGISDVRAHVEAGKGGITAYCSVVATPSGNVPEMLGNLQSLIRQRIREELGIPDILGIKIFVRKFSSARKERIEYTRM